jgi:hypothetical protein
MEILLFAIVVLQVGLFIYSDIQNRDEREKLQLKLMSKTLGEYVTTVEDTPLDSPKDDFDPYIDPGEAGFEQIVSSREK